MIRQADAHSWVEVYFPGLGWQTFDPTPPSGQLAPLAEGIIANVRRLVDGAAMLWYTWVVEYDLERQVGVFRSIGKKLRELSGGLKLPSSRDSNNRFLPSSNKDKNNPTARLVLRWLPVGLAVAVLAWLLVWLVRRRQGKQPAAIDRRLHKAVLKLDRSLRKHDLQRRSWETWSLVASRVAQMHPEAGAMLGGFAVAYNGARFSSAPDQLMRERAIAAATKAAATVATIIPVEEGVKKDAA